MIQPEAYYAAHKRCRTPEELGRLGFIIVGRGEELSPKPSMLELSFAETLMECNKWHSENRDALKEKWRKDKKVQRAKTADVHQWPKDKSGHPMSTNVQVDIQCPQENDGHSMSTTLSHSLSPSLPLSNTPKGVCGGHTRSDVPDLKTVVAAAISVMGVPESFARWWYKEMVARNWTTTSGGRIDHRNWRAQLKAWHNRATPEELAEVNCEAAKATKPVEVKAEDWLLCAERCKNFCAERCLAGHTLPPQMRPRPCPPEECQGFRE